MIKVLYGFGKFLQNIGVIVLFSGLIVTVRDLYAVITLGETSKMELFEKTWFSIVPQSSGSIQSTLEGVGLPFVWDFFIAHVVTWPTAYVLFLIGILFLLLAITLTATLDKVIKKSPLSESIIISHT